LLGAEFPMEAFLVSITTISVAEIGDRTQLLSLLLAARYRRPWPIIAGILCATLANHALVKAIHVAAALLFIVLGLIFLARA
jgi:putative Ca2+/H+ antiporter (TMEM165/GDT1 family)